MLYIFFYLKPRANALVIFFLRLMHCVGSSMCAVRTPTCPCLIGRHDASGFVNKTGYMQQLPPGISKKIGYMQCGLLVVRTWAFPLRGLLVVRTWAFPLRDGILVGCNYVCFSLRAAVLNGPTAACCPALHINGTQAHCCIVCLCDGIPLLCMGSTERGPRSVSGLFSSRAGRGSGGTPGWLAGLEGRQPGFPLVRWVESRFSSGSAGRQLVFRVIFTVSDDVKKTSRNNPCFNIR
jgi:hypothetical protein